MEAKVSLAIRQGLDLIKNESEKDVFLNFETPFVSILMWQCLSTLDNELAKKIVKTGKEKLLLEKSKNWSFNYWLRKSEEYISEPYPDDMDDTFGALRVINDCDPKLIKGENLAKIINLLVVSEKKVGGPYKTWLVKNNKENKWQDVDLAVNCNIGYFLKSQEIELDSINLLVEKAIEKNKMISPYYKGMWPIVYFASRFYKGKAISKLIELIENNISDKNSPMEKAIAVSSLIRLGSNNNDLCGSLINQITEIDQCKEEDFYFYVDKNNKNKKYIGHKLLTIAIVVEALNLYKQKVEKEIKELEMKRIKEKIIKEVKKCFLELNRETRKPITQILKKISQGKNAELILMSPMATTKSLINKNKINEDFLIRLGVINGLGWMAYTIYDDILDGDKNTTWLPIANIIARKMDILFTQLLPGNADFMKEYQTIMNKLEEANWRELKTCRNGDKEIPNFDRLENLSDRSMGHALTSMAVFYEIGANKNDILNLKTFFRLYLAARQMNDDAHDWEKDLKRGQISSAGAELLKISKERENYKELRLIFWEKIFDKYAKRIFDYCKKAKKTIKKINCLENSNSFDKMIDKVMKSTQLALDEKKETIDFIKNYYKK